MPAVSFSGIASGIDTEALIRSTLDQQRRLQVNPLTKRVGELQDTNDALSGLSSRLGTLRNSASSFRLISGGPLSKKFSSSNDSVVSGVASNGAAPGTYDITVSSLAKNGTTSFNDRFTSSSNAINASLNDFAPEADRTISVTFGDGSNAETINVALTSTTSLNDVVSTFNNQSTRATASIVNQGTSASPSYALVFSGKEAGLEKGKVSVSVGSAITTAGSFTSSTTTQAVDAEFSISGVAGTIKRSSNTVSDLLPGVTLNLASLGSSTVSVKTDSAKTTQSVQEFVENFNKLAEYIREQDAITIESSANGNVAVFSPLATSQLDEGALSSIRSALRGSSLTGSPTVNTLSDIGISTQKDGSLALDSKKLQSALSSDPSRVEQLLQNVGEKLSATGGTIDLYTRFGGQIDAAKRANSTQIETYNRRAESVEQSLTRQGDQMRSQFGRLEALLGKLQQQQSALGSLMRF